MFIVRLQQNYAAETRLRAKLEERGLNRQEAEAARKLTSFLSARENEKRANWEEFLHRRGSEVRYGAVVQLQHVLSDKYLQVARERMEHRDGRKVTVDRNAGESAWWRIVPALRVHAEGEPVHVGGQILLESVTSSLSLCVAAAAMSAGGIPGSTAYREVYGGRASEATPLRIEVFRGCNDHALRHRRIMGSQPLRLHHKEGDGALSGVYPPPQSSAPLLPATNMSSESGDAPTTADGPTSGHGDAALQCTAHMATTSAGKASSNAVWTFERVDRDTGLQMTEGGGEAILWDGVVRIRHTSTGHMLAIRPMQTAKAGSEPPKPSTPTIATCTSSNAPHSTTAAAMDALSAAAAGAVERELAGSDAPSKAPAASAPAALPLVPPAQPPSPAMLPVVPESPTAPSAVAPALGSAGVPPVVPPLLLRPSSSLHSNSLQEQSITFAELILISEMDEPEGDATFFELEPQYDTPTAHVDCDQYFFVRHLATGMYLHLADAAEAREIARPSAAAMATADSGVEGAFRGDGSGVLIATTRRYDHDVFGCTLAQDDYIRDLVFTTSCATVLREHLDAFSQVGKTELAQVQRVLSELIFFITTNTTNMDALSREGLPQPERQVLVREQHVLDLCMQWLSAPFDAQRSPFTVEDIKGGHRQLRTALKLAQRLCWNLLRTCPSNREHAADYVPQLQGLLGYSLGVASTLTEIFTDNDVLLDKIDNAVVSSFLDLIRAEGGRQARYLDFLICLCMSRGKARRRNQWRVCEIAVEGAPELFLTLTLTDESRVTITGDPAFFPAFAQATDAPLELSEWLGKTTKETLGYFERSIDLIGVLCAGRNMVNTPKLRSKLPYDLVSGAHLMTTLAPQLHPVLPLATPLLPLPTSCAPCCVCGRPWP